MLIAQYIYQCKVTPSFDSKIYNLFYENCKILNFGANHNERQRLLDKWFYFYTIDASNPITVYFLKHRSNKYGFNTFITNGMNRYAGTALRESNEKIDVCLWSTHENLDGLPKEIEVIELASRDFAKTARYHPNDWFFLLDDFEKQNNIKYKWGLNYNGVQWYLHEKYIKTPIVLDPNKPIWGKDPLGENFEWQLDENPREVKEMVDVNDFPNAIEAIKYLFKQASAELTTNTDDQKNI
jgi:hypothetical protein